jgi:hypothetical protein
LNPHTHLRAADFKSAASANFAIRAVCSFSNLRMSGVISLAMAVWANPAFFFKPRQPNLAVASVAVWLRQTFPASPDRETCLIGKPNEHGHGEIDDEVLRFCFGSKRLRDGSFREAGHQRTL